MEKAASLEASFCPSQAAIEGLLGTELSPAVQHHVLKLLSASDLVHLAISCKALHMLVMEAQPEVWQQAAQQVLPWHPLLPADTLAIQAALNRHVSCTRNILSGICLEPVIHRNLMTGKVTCCQLSPDNSLAACLCSHSTGTSHLTLLALSDGNKKAVSVQKGCTPVSMFWQRSTGHLHVLTHGSKTLEVYSFDQQGQELAVWTAVQHLHEFKQCFWSPDGYMLCVEAEANVSQGRFQFLDFAGRAATPLTTLTHMLKGLHATLADVSICSNNKKAAALVFLYNLSHEHCGHIMLLDCLSGLPCVTVPLPGTHGPDIGILPHTYAYVRFDKLTCWLPGNNTIVVPIEDGEEIVDLGIFSVRDGTCKQLLCALSEACQMDGSIDDIREIVLSPNGQHAAIFYYYGDGREFIEGCIVDIGKGEALISHVLGEDGAVQDPHVYLHQWSPCSRWLAFCTGDSSINAPQPKVRLLDMATVHDGVMHCPVQLELCLYDQIDHESHAVWDTDGQWQLQWAPDGTSVTLLGTWTRSEDKEDRSLQHVVAARVQFA